MKNLTKKIQQKIRTYLTGNVLIFFVCIIVSCVFWFLFTYSENIVYEYEVPIKITNLPDKYIITSKVPQKIRVTSSDIGFHQLHLHWKKDKLPALQIDMTYLVDTTQRQYTVNNKMLRKILHDYPYTSSKQRIIETYPKEFTFHYEILHEKVVPIILVDSSDINDNFMLKNQIQLNHQKVKIFGNKTLLDSINYVYTKPILDTNITENKNIKLALDINPRLKTDLNEVTAIIKIERTTEKSLEIPINIINVPQGTIVRIFPSVAKVTFMVGLSHYKKITTQDFSLTLDYLQLQSTTDNDITKGKLNISTKHPFVKSIRLSPNEVDYVIEQ